MYVQKKVVIYLEIERNISEKAIIEKIEEIGDASVLTVDISDVEASDEHNKLPA